MKRKELNKTFGKNIWSAWFIHIFKRFKSTVSGYRCLYLQNSAVDHYPNSHVDPSMATTIDGHHNYK